MSALGDLVVCAHCAHTGGPFVLVERALVHPECRIAWGAQALCQSVRRLFTPEGMLEAIKRKPLPGDLEFP